MRPQILETDVEQMDSEMNVEDLHSAFYEAFLDCRAEKRSIPDWLEERDEDDYQERVDTMEYYEYVQGEMAAWLSQVDSETIPAETVEEKYKQFKNEHLSKRDEFSIKFF